MIGHCGPCDVTKFVICRGRPRRARKGRALNQSMKRAHESGFEIVLDLIAPIEVVWSDTADRSSAGAEFTNLFVWLAAATAYGTATP